MFNFFKKNTQKQDKEIDISPIKTLTTDIHSHLLAGIDDGAKTLEDSLALIKHLQILGYNYLVTTPHIMSDFYKNTPEIIYAKLAELRQYLKENQTDITIEVAAEYYADEIFMRKVEKGEQLLSFGNNYLLFETGFQDKPRYLMQAIFDLQTAGYKPIFAHPERYQYLYEDFKTLEEMNEKGILLQININSLAGYYGKSAQMQAEKMIARGIVHWAGTDCHHTRHAETLYRAKKTKMYAKLMELPLLNFNLVDL